MPRTTRMTIRHYSPTASGLATPTSSSTTSQSQSQSHTRNFHAGDLSHLHVRVTELRPATDRKSWVFVLEVRCAGRTWQVGKRYSEIREFWEALCGLLVENHDSCTEKCHFLAGCETYKFPKKRLLHTRGVLEERANELEQFFERVTMRLNLCNASALAQCHLDGCSTLALLSSFLEIQTQFKGGARPPSLESTRHFKSVPLLKDRSKDGRLTFNGRLSLATLQEVHSV